MSFGLVLSIALAVGFGIAAIAVTIRFVKRKKPVWGYAVREIIDIGSEAPTEVKVSFNDKQIKDLYRAVVVFFNRGNEAIRKQDVAKKIVVDFGDGQIVKDPVLLAVSREENNFSVNKVSENSVELGFDYLGHCDGGCVEVLHTRGKLPSVSGTIIDAPIKKVGGFDEEVKSLSLIPTVIFGIVFVGMAIYVGLSLDYLLSHTNETIATSRVGLTSVEVAAVVVLAIALSIDVSRIIRSRVFPSWSRNISERIVAAKLTRIGEPMFAYCTRCRRNREMIEVEPVKMRGGHAAFRGRCVKCGTKVFRIGG
jgi:hypothetical protein